MAGGSIQVTKPAVKGGQIQIIQPTIKVAKTITHYKKRFMNGVTYIINYPY